MTRRWRIALGIVFVLCLTLCGLVAGTYVGAVFLTPRNAGLAGFAIAFGYGVLGAVLAAGLGILLAYKLPPKWFLGTALPVLVVAAALVIVFVQSRVVAERERRSQQGEAYDRLNKFRVILVYLKADGAPFTRLEADWKTRRYSGLTNEAEPRTCAGQLSGEEAVALLTALREVEGLVLKNAQPCAGMPGEVERELDWFIPEAKPPDSEGKHAITAECARQFPALEKPFELAADIFVDGDNTRHCSD